MKGQTQIVVDGYTRFCLTAIVVLLTVLIVGLWTEGPSLTDEASAARKKEPIPMVKTIEKAQRDKTAEVVGVTNQKLDKIIQLMESGKLTVVVANLEGEQGEKAPKIKR